MPIFGGSWTNQRYQKTQLNIETGVCAVPHASMDNDDGAQVFIFFQANDINKPVYFAAAQSGPGWFSEHPNQYVIQTDNVRVRIDQQNTDLVYKKYGTAINQSTCFFTTFNEKCTTNGQIRLTKKALVDIEVEATKDIGINLIVNGDVNIQINGNKYQEINGDIYQTHFGNRYIKHTGQTYIENTGLYNYSQVGKTILDYHGETYFTNYNSFYFNVQGSKDTVFKMDGNYEFTLYGSANYQYCGQVIQNYSVSEIKNLKSDLKINACDYTVSIKNKQIINIHDGQTIFNDSVKMKTGATGIISLTNAGHVIDGIVVGIG